MVLTTEAYILNSDGSSILVHRLAVRSIADAPSNEKRSHPVYSGYPYFFGHTIFAKPHHKDEETDLVRERRETESNIAEATVHEKRSHPVYSGYPYIFGNSAFAKPHHKDGEIELRRERRETGLHIAGATFHGNGFQLVNSGYNEAFLIPVYKEKRDDGRDT